MTGTPLPDRFGGMLSQFLAGWIRDSEIHEIQHREVRLDGAIRWWAPVKVASITDLIRTLKGFPPGDNYLTAQRYPAASQEHKDPIIDRIWIDIDPADRRVHDILSELAAFRKVQDALRDSTGRSPMTIVFSGRGFHLWFYLDRPVDLRTAIQIRTTLSARFGLNADPRVPITRYRMMRLPYTLNTRTGWRAVWCTERMTEEDVRYAAISNKEGPCFWDRVYRVDPDFFLKLDSGALQLEISRPVPERRVRFEDQDVMIGHDPLWNALAKLARQHKKDGLSNDEIALRLRRTLRDVEGFLTHPGD